MIRNFLISLALACFAIVAGFLSVVYLKTFLDDYFNREQVQVPKLIGQDFNSAQRFISTFNGRLELKVEREMLSREFDKDTIIGQDPPAGSRVPQGKVIMVTVSTGARTQPIPELGGMRLRKARLTLSGHNLKLGHLSTIRSIEHPGVEEGTVLAQFPAPGRNVAKGETVDLLLAKEPGSREDILMPRLIHYMQDEARVKLRQIGIERFQVDEKLGGEHPPNSVIAQYPAAGRRLAKDQAVRITVSMGSAMPAYGGREIVTSFDMPPGLTQKRLTVKVTDEDGTREGYSAIHSPGEQVTIKITGRGTMKFEYFLDDDPVAVREEMY